MATKIPNNSKDARPSSPVSLVGDFKTVIPATDVDDLDSARTSNPTVGSLVASRIFSKEEGTLLELRLIYPSGVSTVATDLSVIVFGRAGDSGSWRVLLSKAGNMSQPLAIDLTNDKAYNATMNVTTIDNAVNVWDLRNCDQFAVVVNVIPDTNGAEATFFVEASVI